MTEYGTYVLHIFPEIRTEEPPQHPPYGLLQLVGITEQMGYGIGFIDNNAYRWPIDAFRQEIKKKKDQKETWNVIAISGLTTQVKAIMPIVKVCREEYPAALIVGGGGFMSSQPFDIMRWMPEFDIGAVGEAYVTWREILEHLDDKNWSKIKGLVYREGKNTRLSGMRPLIPEEKMDEEIPFPAYDWAPITTYLQYSAIPYSQESMGLIPMNEGEPLRRLDAMASLGCPYKCYFCFHPSCQTKVYGKEFQGKLFRQHSPDYVARLLLHLRVAYSVNFISFIDENFTVNRKWFYDFCGKLEEYDLATKLHWGIVGHSRTVDQEMLAKGHDVGLSYISYGGETASSRILNEMGKGQTPEQMSAAIEATHGASVNPVMSFIVGFPGETIRDVIATLQFFIDNQIHCVPFLLQPYPGTELYDKYKDKIIEQHMTTEEKEFLADPDLGTFMKLKWELPVEMPSKSSLMKNLPAMKEKIRDEALKRWILLLDDATRISCNLTDFSDVELAGLQSLLRTDLKSFSIAVANLERLKKFDETLEARETQKSGGNP
jgi:radical SAM superfamily enzyme YgiQ (UPF0313 family)